MAVIAPGITKTSLLQESSKDCSKLNITDWLEGHPADPSLYAVTAQSPDTGHHQKSTNIKRLLQDIVNGMPNKRRKLLPIKDSSPDVVAPTLSDLQLMGIRVRAVGFSDTRFPLPSAAQVLSANIELIAGGKNVIPDSLKACAKHLVQARKLYTYHFGANTNELIPVQPPQAYNDKEVWQRAGEIVDNARILKQDFASKSAWNTEVYARILNLVLRGWRQHWELCYIDVTTARIQDVSSTSKIVDYAICIAPDNKLDDMIIDKLRSDTSSSINHTRAESIRFKPIAISIGTKRPGMDEDTGEAQLGVWAAAHFERLKQLSRSNDLPMLPQIFVQGHDWRLKVAAVHEGTIVLYGDIHIGDTRSLLGVYKIMACLRYLCHWARIDYKKWFVENCLNID